MRLGKNVGNVYSRGRDIQKVYSHGKLVWEKEVKPIDYSVIPFTIKAVNESVSVNIPTSFKYSINDGVWTTQDAGVVNINKGDRLSIISTGVQKCNITGLSDIYGNIMSLLYGDDYIGQESWVDYSTVDFFKLSDIRHAENLILPATILKPECYAYMFDTCTSLLTAPQLPATTLAEGCYKVMFWGCSSLTAAPQLPATTLAPYCYQEMFRRCSSLTTAPQLPATTLAEGCYKLMFWGCSSLTTTPELPATTLAPYCYHDMFWRCSSLTTAPALPATTLSNYCYRGMFGNTAISTAPELPAEDLVEGCYYDMFYDCSNLNYIKCHARNNISSEIFNDWTAGVSPTGNFVCYKNVGIEYFAPDGWVVEYMDDTDDTNYSVIPFTLEVVKGNFTIGVGKRKNLSTNTTKKIDIKYSINGGEWVSYNAKSIEIELNEKDVVSIISSDVDYISNPIGKGLCDIYGNIMSLIYADDFIGKTVWRGREPGYDPSGMLDGLPIRHAKNLILPATTLTNRAYEYMFYNCTSLITTPELPATTLAEECYRGMFYNCTSLITTPELPATTLAPYCYGNMFEGCTSLTTTPELPATTLAAYCYYWMFEGCTSLITTPELPATTLAPYCYGNMFSNCTSLTTAPELPATTLVEYCYIGMFKHCPLTKAPELPATTLAPYCYNAMFRYCSNLNYIKCYAKNNLNYINSNWTEDVSPTGILVCEEEAASTLKSYIPVGWTVEYIT